MCPITHLTFICVGPQRHARHDVCVWGEVPPESVVRLPALPYSVHTTLRALHAPHTPPLPSPASRQVVLLTAAVARAHTTCAPQPGSLLCCPHGGSSSMRCHAAGVGRGCLWPCRRHCSRPLASGCCTLCRCPTQTRGRCSSSCPVRAAARLCAALASNAHTCVWLRA